MNNKNKKAIQTKTKFLYFPDKVNVLTIFLIVILYGTVLFVSANAVFPKVDYSNVLNYGPGTYNEDLSSHVLFFGNAEEDQVTPGQYKITTKMYPYVRPKNNAKVAIIKYAFSGLDSDGDMRYYIENPRRNDNKYYTDLVYYTDVYRHTFSNSIVHQKDNELDKIFVKVRYRLTVDETEETKLIELSENVLKLDNIDSYKSNNFNDLVTITYTLKDRISDPKQFDSNLKIVLADKTKKSHINLQSWFVTEDDQIIPFIGLYNYSYNKDFDSSNVYVNKVESKYIYTRLVYTDIESGEVSELLYRVDVASLTGNN